RQHLAVDGDAPLGDPPLRIPARAESRPRHHLGDAFAHGACRLRDEDTYRALAAMKASKILVSPVLIEYSGCHCTPRQKRLPGTSMPSMMPSSASASTTTPLPRSLAA